MKKRILSTILALCTVLTILPIMPIISSASTATTVGDFIVTGGTRGTDYSYDGVTLTVLTPTPIKIENADKTEAASNCISVAKDINADITLAGVNIDVSGTGYYDSDTDAVYPGVAALLIADDSKGDVTIRLAEGTETL